MRKGFREKFFYKTKEDSGIALVFALAFITLLGMLAMTFAVTSMLNRRTADNYSAQTISQLSAQAGLQRVITALRIYSNDMDKDFADLDTFSKNQETVSDNTKRESLGGPNGLMNTTINNINYYTLDAENYDVNSNPTWQYLPFDHGPDNPIIGRFAYVALSNLGKIDPSACIDSGENAELHSVDAISEDFPASEATMVDASGTEVIGRPGRNVNELFLETLIEQPDPWFTSTYAEKISSELANPPGKLELASGDWTARWDNLDSLFNKLGVNNDQKDSFKKFFTLNSPADPEALWIDDDGNKIKDEKNLYHRFNLTRTDWDNLAVDSIVSNPTPYTDPYEETSVTSLPWLKNWQSAGGMGSAANCGNQIAANLIDYNDSDYVATTDGNIADSAKDFTATYVGNERCPYINEVKLVFRLYLDNWDGDYGPGSDKRQRQRFRLRLYRVFVELVNMYGEDMEASESKRAELYIDFAAKYNIDYSYLNTAQNPDAWLDSSAEKYFTWSGVNNKTTTINLDYTEDDSDRRSDKNIVQYVWNRSATNVDTWSDYINKSNDIDSSLPNYNIHLDKLSTDILINKLKVKLNILGDSGTLYDFSNIIDQPTSYAFTKLTEEEAAGWDPVLVDGSNDNWYMIIDYQINDPRQNLTGWEIKPNGTKANPTQSNQNNRTYISTLRAKNSNFNPNPGGNTDPEPNATEPWDVSTAYIRNAPMKSPWELGFIHRGDTWQTINLKKYNSDDNIGGGGGGDYDKGDANILDQIKMTADTRTYGKINLNSNLEEVLTLLFQKIRVGSDIASTDGPGSITSTKEVEVAEAALFAAEVLDNNNTNAGSLFYTRAQLLRENTDDSTYPLTDALCYDGAIQGTVVQLDRTNDATQEEIIGKFINLTKASAASNSFDVIVVVQTIKDVGTKNEAGITILEDKNQDGDVLDANESISNCKIGQYDQHADKILATGKIFVNIVRDPVNYGFKVKTFEYLNE